MKRSYDLIFILYFYITCYAFLHLTADLRVVLMYNNPGYIYILKILSKENKRQPGTNKNIPMLIQFEIKELQHLYMAFIPSVSLRPCVPGLHFVLILNNFQKCTDM